MLGILSTIGGGISSALAHITPAMWRWIGILAGVMLIFWIGYSTGARNVRERIESARVEALTEALESERARAAREAALAIELAAKLQQAESVRREEVREVIREIPVMVPDRRECDLPADLIKRLNEVGR